MILEAFIPPLFPTLLESEERSGGSWILPRKSSKLQRQLKKKRKKKTFRQSRRARLCPKTVQVGEHNRSGQSSCPFSCGSLQTSVHFPTRNIQLGTFLDLTPLQDGP
uniref:Uncharacterized protein n=2 Tax=Micrurus TaxID=8634 RepID=A0A2D4L264_9SAUR